ncbi:MAG TPA: AraC family transcriptional regulator [Thermoanaerobaculia bacterium]|nr:AraC family transcriptional regulator [Thermoanaerobaculia bacterium]
MTSCGDVAVTITTPHFCVSEVIAHAETLHAHALPWLEFALPGDARSIVIEGVSSEAARTVQELAERRCRFRDATLRPLFLRLRRELRDGDRAAPMAVDGAVFLLLAELDRMTAVRGADAKSLLACQLEAVFDENPGGVTVAQLAACNHMSTRTYVRHFRLETGFSVTEYWSQLRAGRAKMLLRTTSLSILEIALSLGYCDRSHFARAFSQAVGLTPSQYRGSIV